MTDRLRTLLVVLIVHGAILASGCTPMRFTSEYDEETDRRVTELHHTLEAVLTAIEEELAVPETEALFPEAFPHVLIELRSLKLRASARPMNELQVAQFDQLEAQLNVFAKAFAEGLHPSEVAIFRRGFEQTFRAILTLEFARKRGAE